MRRRQMLLVLFCAAVLVMAHHFAGMAWATNAVGGYKSMPLCPGCSGTFQEIEVFNHATKKSLPSGFEGKLWLSLQRTKGASDLYIQSNIWPPVTMGIVASTGWHTHPGHSLIIVTAGTITEYHADCKPHVYQVGDTFVDPGEGEEHIIRNESSTEPAATVAVQLVPHDPLKANRRIDAPAPETCSNIN
ncbi:cupin domain-containing protein [Edaphobacter aggregans]|uniref:cupin domain-containing protein n=1 Tax=Edaphobacter aggregans TaxID=570835 RepID=UPI001B80D9BB|nr:cupin domain-containing protein [Edaphobacter aggregans]